MLAAMFLLSIFWFTSFTPSLISSNGLANLLGFYMSYRKLCLCRCGISQNQIHLLKNSQSMEGELYSPSEMPWLAMIYTKNSSYKGTLVSDRHILTAASPFYGLPTIHVKVALGFHEQCKENHALNISVEAILIHPEYSHAIRNNDIALLKLRHGVQFSQYISPICMPLYGPETEHLAWAALGFHTCHIRIVSLPITNSQSCTRSARTFNNFNLTPDKGCIGPLGSKSIICQEDIGGPVMTRWMPGSPFRLGGIITFASCEKDITPLFTKTVDNLLWIHQNIRNDCQCF